MPTPTYAQIQPLVAQQQLQGSTVHVVFQCPVTGEHESSTGPVRKGKASAFLQGMKGRAMSQLRWSLANMVRSALGGGYLGRTGSTMVHEATSGTTSGARAPTQGETQAAVVEAFAKVQSQFCWDVARGGWVHASAKPEQQTAFAQLMGGVSIIEPFDRLVMARMLAEIAVADGYVDEGERDLVAAFTGGDLGSVEDLMQYPALSPNDLQSVSQPVRQAMLTLAWAVAFADEELEHSENERLAAFAVGLGLGGSQAQQASHVAREYVIDLLFDTAWADGQADEQERNRIYAMASGLGLDQAAIHAMETKAWQRHQAS